MQFFLLSGHAALIQHIKKNNISYHEAFNFQHASKAGLLFPFYKWGKTTSEVKWSNYITFRENFRFKRPNYLLILLLHYSTIQSHFWRHTIHNTQCRLFIFSWLWSILFRMIPLGNRFSACVNIKDDDDINNYDRLSTYWIRI